MTSTSKSMRATDSLSDHHTRIAIVKINANLPRSQLKKDPLAHPIQAAHQPTSEDSTSKRSISRLTRKTPTCYKASLLLINRKD